MTYSETFEALTNLLGDRLSRADSHRDQHSHNETYFPQSLPDAVAYPVTTKEVSAILRICHDTGCPVTAFGAATALEGQHLAVKGGVSLDLMRMNRVLSVHSEDLSCVVQPGVTRKALNEELRATGLFFPVDPGADASLGGMAATRASGTTAVRYGTMRENVLAVEAVMADGTVIRTGTGARKSSTGYDLTHLLVGSEGTLGILTELTVKLYGRPEATRAAICRFDTVADAVNCVILTIQSGLPVARIELVDAMMVRGFNLHSQAGLPETPHLFVEFQGTSTAVAEQVAEFRDIASEFGMSDFAEAEKAEDRNRLWAMRHNAHFATAALAPGKRTLSTDICVPISKLAEAVTLAQDRAEALGLISAVVGHVGDGNFHCGLRIDPEDPDEMTRAKAFTGALNELALQLGGTVSGEHGIGLGKQAYMAQEHGDALAYMRAIKRAWDPKGILNPGKLLPPGNA